VIETNTFRANRPALAACGLAEQVEAINRAAAGLARQVADGFSTEERPRFVAGAMGPAAGSEGVEPAAAFEEQAAALIECGVDLILLETFQDAAELAAAVDGVKRAMAAAARWLPIQAQVSPGVVGEPSLLDALLALPVEVIGLNCGDGPTGMAVALAYLVGRSHKPLACLPNAGLPARVEREWVYPVKPADFARIVGGYQREYGVQVIGGCCGTTPAHIELLAKGL
jgi:5-methyltetrahydrofolate--homocysteine methyltransferase